MNNCFEVFLTDACRTCPYWKDDENAVGCASPFPIMHCDAFAEAVNATDAFDSNDMHLRND